MSWQTWLTDNIWLVPAAPLIVNNSAIANKHGNNFFASPMQKEMFAVTGRVIKDGHSIALLVPHVSMNDTCMLMHYLHRVRLDANSNVVCGRFFNRSTVARKSAILFIGSSSLAHRVAKAYRWLNVTKLPTSARLLDSSSVSSSLAHTYIGGENHCTIDYLDELSNRISPFVIIIDASPNGIRNDVSQCFGNLNTYFPHIPIVTMGSPDNANSAESLMKLPTHVFRWRLGDFDGRNHVAPLGPGAPHTEVVPDELVVNNFAPLMSELFLKKRQHNSGETPFLNECLSLLKLYYELPCRISSLERQLEMHARGGLFAVRTLSRRHDLLKKMSPNYGDLLLLQKSVLDSIDNIHTHYQERGVGKFLCIKKLLTKFGRTKASVLIVVANRYQRFALEYDLAEEGLFHLHDGTEVGAVTIVQKSDRPDARLLNYHYDHAVICCSLWPHERHWLNGWAKNVHFLSYSFEEKWAEITWQSWWNMAGVVSDAVQDKENLLQFSFCSGVFLKDLTVSDLPAPAMIRTLHPDCAPVVRSAEQHGEFDLNIDTLALFMSIMESEVHERKVDATSPTISNSITVHFTEKKHPVIFDEGASIKVLTHDDSIALNDVKVRDLLPGDKVVLVRDGSGRRELLDEIYKSYVDDPAMHQILHTSYYWFELIDLAADKIGNARQIKEFLQDNGISREQSTIRLWLSHKGFGPQDCDILLVLGKRLNHAIVLNNYHRIFNAINKIRGIRIQLGKLINHALTEDLNQSISIEGHDISASDIMDMIDILHVDEVVNPAPVALSLVKSMEDLIPEVQTSYSDELIITKAGLSSMRKAAYNNIPLARKCFHYLANDIRDVFLQKVRLVDVATKMEQDNIAYIGGTSDTTQGRFSDYQALYKGKNADLGKHLRVGNSRVNKSTVLRIHFDWDSDDQKVVIHHAGNHLRTTKS